MKRRKSDNHIKQEERFRHDPSGGNHTTNDISPEQEFDWNPDWNWSHWDDQHGDSDRKGDVQGS
jgi:hypothetical protein